MSARLRRAVGAVLFLAAACAPTGCTFAFLDGNGPKSRSVYAAHLPAASNEQLEQWKADAFRRHWLFRHRSRVEATGYTVHSGASFPWAALAGRSDESTFVEPAPAHQESIRAIVWRAESRGVLGILCARVWSRWHDYPSGECILASRWTWLGGPLLVFGSDTEPACESGPGEGSRERLDWTNRRVALNDLKYNRTSFICFGLGLFAAGTRNGRAYAQLAWIPVPLWSVE